VSAAAAKLNAIVRDNLLAAGVPAVSFSAHSSAECHDGKLVKLATLPIQSAITGGLIPLIYGDVAFDRVRGGTIVSTEEIMSYLAHDLQPRWLLLAGETDGVYDLHGVTIPLITHNNLAQIRSALGGSRGTDVTGGMVTKVLSMLDLVAAHPTLSIRIFSGLPAGAVRNALIDPESVVGTTIR
jgi:isopentenyl phosphate kinase